MDVITVKIQTKKCFDMIQDEIEKLNPYAEISDHDALRLCFEWGKEYLRFITSPRLFEKVKNRLIFLNLSHSHAF